MRKTISRFFLMFALGIFAMTNTQAASAPDDEVLLGFAELNTYINALADDGLNKGQRRSFLSKTQAAERAYLRGQICTARNQMKAFLNRAQALRKSRSMAIGEDLYNRGRSLRDSFFDVFVSDPSMTPPRCFRPSMVEPPQVSMVASDNTIFSASINFGAARMWSVQLNGETYTEMELPGLPAPSGVPGLPGIPVWRGLIAVPTGAVATLSMNTPPVIGETLRTNLYPYQTDPVDQILPEFDPEFANTPFVKDGQAYATDAFFPPNPCSLQTLGQYRDLQIVQVQCSAAQYNPVTDELRLFESVAFSADFDGGDGTFINSQTLSPFETTSSSVIGSVLNKAAVPAYVKDFDITDLICLGEELLILTHPNFRPAADDLAQWKEDKGIITTVINVGAGTSYGTGDEIDDLIEDRYDRCQVRLSYVLVLGDVEFVPPAATDYDISPDETTGSDWGYALYPQVIFDVFFPDFGVARISVDTAAEAQRVVDKIIKYESDPPFSGFGSGAPFYTTASLASQFQCCRMNQDGSPAGGQNGRTQRSFIEASEAGRNAMTAAGKTAERIYMETIDNGGYCLVEVEEGEECPADKIQQPYSGNATPNRYYNGTLLPPSLRSGSGFLWNGSTQDIADAFNDGRFLITHRDHGNSSGFGNPSFTNSDLFKLNNDELLPVVYSVNCASGYFDRETDTAGAAESFMERLLMEPDGGMVGGLGDVRNSPTWPNSALTRGFFDATWPNVAPEYGGGMSVRRLADILNHGKVYLLTQVGVPQTAGSISFTSLVDEYIMWHAYGDPTLEMWTSNPHSLILTLDHELEIFLDFLHVRYAEEGAEITAFQKTQLGIIPIGRAMVNNGMAEIPFFHPPEPGVPILLSASLENAVSVLLTPAGPGRQPDLVVQDLILASSILHPGDDLSTMLGVKVGNLGGAVADGTIKIDGTTKAGYMIDLVLSTDTSMPGSFANLPLPAGDAYAEDGLLQGGRISRTPDVPAATDLELSTAPPISSDIGGIIPLQAPGGEINLCARIDPGDIVTESDETNNVFCRSVFIEPPTVP